MNDIKTRTQKFLIELELPVTTFGRHVNLSRSAIYAWLHDQLNLGADAIQRIDDFITKYGF